MIARELNNKILFDKNSVTHPPGNFGATKLLRSSSGVTHEEVWENRFDRVNGIRVRVCVWVRFRVMSLLGVAVLVMVIG